MPAKQNQKRAGRRRRRFTFLLLVLAVLTAATFVMATVFFKIETISVSGDGRYSSEEIIEFTGLTPGKNIFTVSEERLTALLRPEFPYIDSVSVVRHLPNHLEIVIHEYQDLYASMSAQGRVTVMSADGYVMEQCASLPDYTCLILGGDFSAYPAGQRLPEEWTPAFQTLSELLPRVEEAGLSEALGYVEISDLLDMKLLLYDRVLVLLGSDYEMETKLLTAKTVIEQELEQNYTGTLNVSVLGRAFSHAYPPEEIINPQYLAILSAGG